jgi:hypothetical protein
LMEQSIHFPKTHDLLDLVARLGAHRPTVPRLTRGLRFLNYFAVDVRYPPVVITKR